LTAGILNSSPVKTPGSVGCKKFRNERFAAKYFQKSGERKYALQLKSLIVTNRTAATTTTNMYGGRIRLARFEMYFCRLCFDWKDAKSRNPDNEKNPPTAIRLCPIKGI
jgi:hypothetical protein